MNILITGANGQLGNEFKQFPSSYMQHRFFFTDVNSASDEYLDITDKDAVEEFIIENEIDVVINCAAYTDVKSAEIGPETLAAKLNVHAPLYLSDAIRKRDGLLIHISTDYVFDGNKNTPYTEDDIIRSTLNDYGITKLGGELQIKDKDKTIIIRTSWLYSHHGKNFVKTIIGKLLDKNELKIVDDQIGTPTYAADLALAIMKIISCYENGTAVYGIFHYSNEGVCTWFEFAKAIAEYSGLWGFADIKPCSSDEIMDNVKRPTYSVLSKKKIIKEYDVDVPYWRDSLKKCISKLSK